MLADYRARIAAHERVAAEVLAALDGLEEERLPGPANLAIRGERGFNVSQEGAGYRHQVALAGQLQEFIQRG